MSISSKDMLEPTLKLNKKPSIINDYEDPIKIIDEDITLLSRNQDSINAIKNNEELPFEIYKFND